jgi:hypothetical protein
MRTQKARSSIRDALFTCQRLTLSRKSWRNADSATPNRCFMTERFKRPCPNQLASHSHLSAADHLP